MKHSKNDQKQFLEDTRLDSRQIDYTELGNKKKKKRKEKTHILPMRFVSQYNITKKKLTIAINLAIYLLSTARLFASICLHHVCPLLLFNK